MGSCCVSRDRSGENREERGTCLQQLKMDLMPIEEQELDSGLGLLTTSIQEIEPKVPFIFQQYDKNKSGYLEINELKEYLSVTFKQQGINYEVTDQFLEEFLVDFDSNKDRKISPEEFADFYKQYLYFVCSQMKSELNRRKALQDQ
jgi:hypothetical protein